LRKKNYVIGEIYPSNGRFSCVSLTERGEGVISNLIKKYTDYIEEILRELDIKTVKEINLSLDILSNLVKRHEMI